MIKTRTVRLWARDEDDRQPKVVGGERPAAWDRYEPSGILYDLTVPASMTMRKKVVRRFALARKLQVLEAEGVTLKDLAETDPGLAVELMGVQGTLVEVARG